MPEKNSKIIAEFMNELAYKGRNGLDEASGQISVLGAIAQMLAAIADELHELNERSKQDG